MCVCLRARAQRAQKMERERENALWRGGRAARSSGATLDVASGQRGIRSARCRRRTKAALAQGARPSKRAAEKRRTTNLARLAFSLRRLLLLLLALRKQRAHHLQPTNKSRARCGSRAQRRLPHLSASGSISRAAPEAAANAHNNANNDRSSLNERVLHTWERAFRLQRAFAFFKQSRPPLLSKQQN